MKVTAKVKTPDEYRKLTKFLDDSVIPYHTFPLPQEKPIRAVIKKLPGHTLPEDIYDELKELGIPVKTVRQVVETLGIFLKQET